MEVRHGVEFWPFISLVKHVFNSLLGYKRQILKIYNTLQKPVWYNVRKDGTHTVVSRKMEPDRSNEMNVVTSILGSTFPLRYWISDFSCQLKSPLGGADNTGFFTVTVPYSKTRFTSCISLQFFSSRSSYSRYQIKLNHCKLKNTGNVCHC